VAWLAIVVAGASGNAINVLVQRPEHLSVGASTAVFAALGLLASVSFFFGAMHRETWARRWSPLVGGLWLLTWLGTGDARTDIVAHLTGFVAGLLLGGAAGWLAPTAGRDRPVQWAAGAATLLLIVAGWGAAFRQQLFG
jgi:membrane associated rhomboid family serine protease